MKLPSSLEAEKALLGIIINKNDTIYEVPQSLVAGDFYERMNGELYHLLRDLIDAGRQVTGITLIHDAQDSVVWGDVKASEYIAQLERDAPLPSLIGGFANTVRETARLRRLHALGEELQSIAINSPVSITADELRVRADEAVAALFTDVRDLGLRRLPEIGDDIVERLKVRDKTAGLKTPLANLTRLAGLLMPGRLYVIGGSPGSGKSALALQIGRGIGEERVALLFSIEMDTEEQAERSLSTATGIKAEEIERGGLDDTDFERLWQANEQARRNRLYIDGSSQPTLATIRGRSLRLQKLEGLDLVLIDHIHYMAKPDKRMGEYDALDENLKGLKKMAKDLNVPVVVLAQFGTEALRELAKWPHRNPTQGDLLASGIIDRNADVIVLLHRREYFLHRSKPDDRLLQEWEGAKAKEENRARLILTKRRGGLGYGEAEVGFDAGRAKFIDDPGRVFAVRPVVEDDLVGRMGAA